LACPQNRILRPPGIQSRHGWWLKTFSEVAKLADLDLVDSPLIVSPDDLAEVVEALARQRDAIKAVFDDPPTQSVSYEVKNAINNMTKE